MDKHPAWRGFYTVYCIEFLFLQRRGGRPVCCRILQNPRVHFHHSHVTRSGSMHRERGGGAQDTGGSASRGLERWKQRPDTACLSGAIEPGGEMFLSVRETCKWRVFDREKALYYSHIATSTWFLQIAQHRTKERWLSDIMLQEKPERNKHTNK